MLQKICGKQWSSNAFKTLLDGGYIHGDCMTVTGKTMRQI